MRVTHIFISARRLTIILMKPHTKDTIGAHRDLSLRRSCCVYILRDAFDLLVARSYIIRGVRDQTMIHQVPFLSLVRVPLASRRHDSSRW